MNRSIFYSIAMPLNRGGMGSIAWHACRAFHGAGLLNKVVSTEVGAAGEIHSHAHEMSWVLRKGMRVINRLGYYHAHDKFFDYWASQQIEKGSDYYGWLNYSLACIRKCHEGGGRAFVDRGSVEPRLQQQWLEEEYRKYGQYGIYSQPMSSASVKRMVAEADETDFIVVPSTLVADSYKTAGYDAKKIKINALGVDLNPSTEKKTSEREKLRFVFVGQLSIQKGIPRLLQSWGELDNSQSELVLAGIIPPDEHSVIKPLLDSASNIIWEGHCQNVPALLQTCDVLILPSAQDGFGLVVLEAMAAGLPVIVSDRVGAKDCVENGKNGFIFSNFTELIDRMEWFLQDTTRVENMRLNAKATAQTYSWEAYGKRLVSIYQSAS